MESRNSMDNNAIGSDGSAASRYRSVSPLWPNLNASPPNPSHLLDEHQSHDNGIRSQAHFSPLLDSRSFGSHKSLLGNSSSILSPKKSPFPSKVVGDISKTPRDEPLSPAFATPFGNSLFAAGWYPSTSLTSPSAVAAFNMIDSPKTQDLGLLPHKEPPVADTISKPELKSKAEESSPDISLLLSGMNVSETLEVKDASQAVETEDGSSPSKSLWVGNIDPSLNESDLVSVFSEFGPVESIRLLPEKECAFVNFVNVKDSVVAKNQMQGARMGSCIVKIGFGRSESSSESTQSPLRSLWIGNLSSRLSSDELVEIFSRFGPVESLKTLPHRNCGFVNFFEVKNALDAKNSLNGQVVDGMPLKISFAKPPADKSSTPVPHEQNKVSSSSLPISPALTPVLNQQKTFNNKKANISQIPQYKIALQSHGNAPGVLSPMYEPQTKLSDSDMALPDPSAFVFADAIEPLPTIKQSSQEGKKPFSVDSVHLREYRKKLESPGLPQKEFDAVFDALLPDFLELSTDAFGNTISQKLIEKCSDQQRLLIVEKCAPYLPAIGIHKNGTWVVQKLIECTKTTTASQILLAKVKMYTPALMMDPFGNYVVQGCLKLGSHRNQFIFDTMFLRCLEIGQGKFGARAMRACLESQHATEKQQRLVSLAVFENALALITNPNGILLLHWIVDSNIAERYRDLIPKILPKISLLCNQKLAHVVLLKILNQTFDLASAELLINGIFETTENITATMFGGSIPTIPNNMPSISFVPAELGTVILLKCLQVSSEPKRKFLAHKLWQVINSYLPNAKSAKHGQFFRRLLDELEEIKTANTKKGLLDERKP